MRDVEDIRPVWDRIDEAARAFPQRVALCAGGRHITYEEALSRSQTVAAYLQRQLGNDATPVLVWGHKEPDLLVAFLAAARSGHPYVPLDSDLPQHRLEQVRALSRSRLTVTAADLRGLQASCEVPAAANLTADTPLYIIFTSGTSGEPKGVIITHGGLAAFLQALSATHTLEPGREVVLNTSPFSFDFSILDIYLALACGGTVYCLTRDDIATPRIMFERLAECGVTIWNSTPTFLRLCLAERSFGPSLLPALKRFVVGGETLPADLVRRLWERFPDIEIWNLYGPTEATVFSTLIRLGPQHLVYPTIPIGTPLPRMRIDLQGGDTPQRGEIVIVGPQVSPGYLHQPQASAEKFCSVDGQPAYRTGDWGHRRDGLLLFDGRRDRQIKHRGHRVELEEVETNLRALPGVEDAAVVHRGGKDSVAYVIGSGVLPADAFDAAVRLREQLAQRLPRYMVPQHIHWLRSFPMTANGKVDYARLTAQAGGD